MNFNIIINTLFHILKYRPSGVIIKNFFKYQFYSLFPPLIVKYFPISLVVYLTKRCNFKCNFCFTYDQLNKSDWKDYELSVVDFKKILCSEAGRHCLRIGLLGGEPFLNKDLFKILDLAHKHRKITTIVTNASQINSSIKAQLMKSHPTMLGISLYDNNISEVADLSKWLALNKIPFWVQTVITADDISKMLAVLDFAKKNNIKNLILSNYQPSYSKEISKVIYDDNTDFFLLANQVKKIAKTQSINLTLPNAVQRKTLHRTCKMPFSYIHVDAKGNIGPCCFRPPEEQYGNIFQNNFWNNKYLITLRSSFLKKNSELLSPCNTCENLSRDLYGI